jgi:hypothetical protein
VARCDRFSDGFCRGGDSRITCASLGGYAETHATSLGEYGYAGKVRMPYQG